MKKLATIAMSATLAFVTLAAPVLAQENSNYSTSTTSTVRQGENGRGNTKGMEQKNLHQSTQASEKSKNQDHKITKVKNNTALTAANQTYRAAVKAANTAYETAIKVARDARKTALDAALATFKAAQQAAQPVATSTPTTTTTP